MATKKKDETTVTAESIDVVEVVQNSIEVCVVGTRPLMHNRLAQKAQRQLLMPSGRKTAVEKALTLKHEPIKEFQASPHTLPSESAPTLLALPSAAFKRAMATAALDLPGTKKAQIGRLTYVDGDYVPVYGHVLISAMAVRMSDIARTPDIRFRAIMPRWAARLSVTYVEPLIRSQAVLRLLAAAGVACGVGDGRVEKGALTFGLFRIVSPSDPEFKEIVKTGGRAAQVEAMRVAEPYDEETSELVAWYDEELARRRQKGAA